MMTEERVTLANYLESTKDIVDQVEKEREFLHQFNDDLDLLEEKAQLFDDTLKILLSWEDGITRTLHKKYTDQQLLELHGIGDGKLHHDQGLQIIFLNNNPLLKFVFCDHLMYSPVDENYPSHQCLLC